MATYEQSLAQLKMALNEEVNDETNIWDIDKEFEGVATYIMDISNFFIVPWRFYRLMHILEKPGSLLKEYASYTVVVYLSPTYGRHVRGMIQEVLDNKSCTIFAMDYGLTDFEVLPSHIFNLRHPDAENIPGLAQLCELSMCYPRGEDFTESANNTFRYFMGEDREKLTILVKENNMYSNKVGVLVMSSKTNPDDVSTVLAFTEHSVFYTSKIL